MERISKTAPSPVLTDTPSIGGLENPNSTPLNDHTWTIVGSVVGFVLGVFVGMLVTAFFFRRSNVFRHSKNERTRRRRRRDLEDHGNERKSECFNYTGSLCFLSAACISVPSQID